jgi:hypothetical protein
MTVAMLALFMTILSGKAAGSQPNFLGENLTAEISFLNIPVATANLRVTQETSEVGQPVFHLAISAKSTPFYSILYRVDNRYDSFFTWPEVRTLRYQRHISEPGVDLRRVVTYQNGLAHCGQEEPVPVPPEVGDIFSTLYALRGQPLRDDQVIDSPLDLDGQLWLVRAKVLGRERVKTRLATHQAIKVQVNYLRADQTQRDRSKSDILTNNLVREKTRVIIWFSDDERKIPLKAQCRAAPFTIKALFSTTE